MKTYIKLLTIVFIMSSVYAVLQAINMDIPQTVGLLLIPIVIWFYMIWRKNMRLEETFVGIQFIED